MTTPLKGTTVDTSNLQTGELIPLEFAFYNVTSIRGFTSILNVYCINNRMLWVFPTASQKYPVYIILFILTIVKNEQHPHKRVRVDEYGSLENSTYIKKLLC